MAKRYHSNAQARIHEQPAPRTRKRSNASGELTGELQDFYAAQLARIERNHETELARLDTAHREELMRLQDQVQILLKREEARSAELKEALTYLLKVLR